jgi:hypothetical protein
MKPKRRRYIEQSYESRLLFWLDQLHRFCEDNRINYALFGGAAVGAYVGHLPRKLHDIDLISHPATVKEITAFLIGHGFDEQCTVKARKAQYSKFVFRNHIYEMIVSVFPMRFTLLDLDHPKYEVLGSYDFADALERRRLLPLQPLGRKTGISVWAISFEDLVVSKLWPTFEPNTIHDLLLLLTSKAAEAFEPAYFSTCVQRNSVLSEFAAESLERFEHSYPRTAWFRLARDQTFLARRIELLRDALCDRAAGSCHRLTTSAQPNGTLSSPPVKARAARSLASSRRLQAR